MAKHPNYRLVKIHRTYTVEEIGTRLTVHRNTVRQWIKRGLPTIDNGRPLLVHGQDLVSFLRAQRTKNKRKCQPGEIYCVRCRAPRNPAGGMADYVPLSVKLGNLVGICPSCDSLLYRRVNLTRLEEIRGRLSITLPLALARIGESR